MVPQPELTDAEWALIGELLEHERDELPTEIHHTRTDDFRQGLLHRRELVEGLLAKIPRMQHV